MFVFVFVSFCTINGILFSSFLHLNLKISSVLSNESDIVVHGDCPCASVRLSLLCDSTEVRAAGLRALRYLITDGSVLDKVLALNVDYLIAR